MIGLAVMTRLPAIFYPRAIDDEAVYGVVARVMLAGGLPYRDAIERKPPLLFAVYWAVFRLFGAYDWVALHLIGVMWVLLTMAGLFVMARRLGGRRAGIYAALSYALVQPFATAKNLAFNGEVLMNLPLVWAYALILAQRPGKIAVPVVAGALLGAAFLLKQPAAIAAVPLGLYLLCAPLWREGKSWGRAFQQAAALTTGFAAVLGVTVAILWRYGLMSEAWYWTMADHSVPHVFWGHAAEHSALFLLMALPLILPLVAWHPLQRAWHGREAELWTVLGWLGVSVVGAAAGGRFYPHYYIQIVPPLAVLAGITYARVHEFAPVPLANTKVARANWVSPRFAGIWLAVAGLVTFCIQTGQLLGDRASSAAANYVAERAQPADRLFVWGQETKFYIDAGLLPASRYIATYPLTGYIFGGALPGVSTRNRIVPGAWDNLAADFQRHPPAFILDSQTAPNDTYPIRDFPFMARLVARDYQRVGTFTDGVVYRRRSVSLVR